MNIQQYISEKPIPKNAKMVGWSTFLKIVFKLIGISNKLIKINGVYNKPKLDVIMPSIMT